MPVRSLHSSILRWPDPETVETALRLWVERAARQRDNLLLAGYFGSYARGDASVGSDLDIILVVEDSDTPFVRRAAGWDTTTLPVPVDLVVYTRREWSSLNRRGRFCRTVQREGRWLHVAAGAESLVPRR